MRIGLILLLLGLLLGHGSVIHGQVYEICDNGIDDDGDLLVDCDDNDCILVYRFSSPPGSINEGTAVDLGDVDGDGDLDAWICQVNSTQDILWINDGDGHFTECQIPIGAFDSRDVQLGDLDGDGDLDAFLVVGEFGSVINNPNRVYFNDGDGNFVNSGQALGSAFSLGVELGDLDGDGDLDAWVANAEPTQDRVWFNDGDGNFSTSGNGYGAISSLAVALGDVDGDGDLDAVTSGLINGSILESLNLLYLNDGTGTFTPSNQNLTTTGYLGEDVELADLDGDGDLDLWIPNGDSSSNTPNLWINSGGGEFSPHLQPVGLSSVEQVVLGDLDGDGDLDAVLARREAENAIFINDGAANFTPAPLTVAPTDTRALGLGDLDGDGDLDLLESNGQDHSKRVYFNDGAASFTGDPRLMGNTISWGVALGDLDSDGDLDAWVANRSEQGCQVWMNDGMGEFTATGQQIIPPGSSLSESREAALGDIDNDGDLDAWVANGFSQPDEVWLNDGNGLFTWQGQALGDLSSHDVELGDLNSDGSLDAVVCNLDGITPLQQVWFNDGAGFFQNSGQTLGNDRSLNLKLGDLDDDGDLDVWVGVYSTQQSSSTPGPDRVWLNNGNGFFTDSGQLLGNSSTRALDLADLDGDGDLDAWVNAPPNQDIWFNDGSANFTLSTQSISNPWGTDIDLVDVDGDGDVDAWITAFGYQQTSSSQLWLNDGSGVFSQASLEPCTTMGVQSAAGDLDSDGDPDFFVATLDANHVAFNQIGCIDDVDLDGIPNPCDVDFTPGPDCDQNGALDSCQPDTDGDGLIDACDPDIDNDGIANECDADHGIGNNLNGNDFIDNCETPFTRGNINADDSLDLSDAISLLGFIFFGEPIPCLAAADINDDEVIDLTDPILLLDYLYTNGEAPYAPFPGCGIDPTVGEMECDNFDGC